MHVWREIKAAANVFWWGIGMVSRLDLGSTQTADKAEALAEVVGLI